MSTEEVKALVEELRYGAEYGCDAGLIERAADAIEELISFDIRNLPEGLYTVKNGVVYTARVKVSGGNVLNLKTGESHWEDDRIVGGEQVFPKRGEWKKISNRDDGTADYECSACHGIIIDVPNDDERPLVSYCPMCGARMTVAARCKHMDKNGFCLIISDSEVREHCVEGPCRFYEEVPDDRK